MVYFGKIKNGKVVPDPGVSLPEGARVRIETVTDTQDPADSLSSEALDTGVADLSEEHDHYASGAPRRSKKAG